MSDKTENQVMTVNSHEKKLIELIRQLGFGEILVHVADKQPVRAEEIKKSVKL